MKQWNFSCTGFFRFLFLIMCCSCVLIFPTTTFAQTKDSELLHNTTYELTKGWQYRLGNSPLDSTNQPLWAVNSDDAAWMNFKYPGSAPNKDKILDTWFRVKLPASSLKNASLLLSEQEQEVEVYLNGKLIYGYGNMNIPAKYKRIGSPLLIIPLPDNYENQIIYFRLRAFSTINAGLIKKLILGTKADFITEIINEDIDKLILSSIFIFIALVTIVLSTFKKVNQKAFFPLGFFSLIIAFWIIGMTNMKLLFYNNPKFWFYDVHITNYLIPVGFLMYVEQIFATGKLKKLVVKLWQFQILFTLFAIIMDLTNLSILYNFITIHFVFVLIYISISAYILTRNSSKGNYEARIFLLGFLVLALFGIYEFLYSYFLIFPYSRSLLHYGLLIFILSQLTILAIRFIDTYGKLRIYLMEIETKNKTLNQMWKEIKHSRDMLAQWNENLEETVRQKTAAIKNILDNAGEGFFTFGDDLIIDEECSSECAKIFGKEISGIKFSSLIFPDGDERDYLELMLVRTLHEKKDYKKEIYLPLLPNEKVINEKYIKLDYKIIIESKKSAEPIFMVILTDITEKRFLENKMEAESKVLKMVVKAVTNYNDFIKFIRDYEHFCKTKILEILDSDSSLQNIVFELFRTIHTFKGSFGQMNMVNIAQKLHTFETKLSEININLGTITLEEFKIFISEFNISEWLKEDINILNEILGEEYFIHKKALTIDQTKLLQIENNLTGLLTPTQLDIVLPQLRELRYRPFKELLKTYPQFVSKLSERLKKPMNPIEVRGKDVLVDSDKFHDFSVSLVHVFRNIMDHGIEEINERISMGKNEAGNIKCNIKLDKDNIMLIITDDGKGIDINNIKQIAVEKNIFDTQTIDSLKDNEILHLIFKDGFTTKDKVSELSGRGVGLAVVMQEIEKLNGKVRVNTKLGAGTEFHFLLPL